MSIKCEARTLEYKLLGISCVTLGNFFNLFKIYFFSFFFLFTVKSFSFNLWLYSLRFQNATAFNNPGLFFFFVGFCLLLTSDLRFIGTICILDWSPP